MTANDPVPEDLADQWDSLEERQVRVSRLVLRKVPASEIAHRLHISVRTVYADIQRIRRSYQREMFDSHERLLAQELAGLASDEHAMRKKWRRLEKDDEKTETWLKVYDRILRIIERRAKFLGLDAPDEIRLDVPRVQHVMAQLVVIVCRYISDIDHRKAIAKEATLLLDKLGMEPTLWTQEQIKDVKARVRQNGQAPKNGNGTCGPPPSTPDSDAPKPD